MFILCIIVPKMNCSLKSNGHKHSPYNRLCVDIFHFVSRFATVSLSHIRENFLKMWNASSIIYIYLYMDIVWPYCVNTVDVLSFRRRKFPRTLQVFMEIQKLLVPFLPLRVCSYSCPSLHLFAALENSTLRLDRGSLAHKFPCTLPIMLTGCPECPWTFRCNWTLHSRRTCRSRRDQVQRRFSLCHNSLFSLLFFILFAIVSGQLVELKF